VIIDLNKLVLKGILSKGYTVPTPIQRKAIPKILEGGDVVAMARTGSGKTAAFVVPLLQRLRSHSAKVGVRALILSPTRELALQTMRFTADLGRFTDLRACVIVGGDSMDEQFDSLARNPDIIIATPGRLVHHLVEVDMSLGLVEYIVFDEADRLFEMGFAQQIEQIMSKVSSHRQTVLMSATMPKILVDFAKAGLNNPTLLRLDTETQISENLKLSFLLCRGEEKLGALIHLLTTFIEQGKLTIVFVATRHHVEFIQELLKCSGVSSCGIYGTMDQTARKMALQNFRRGNPHVMLVTDVAARGIDVPLLDNVINFDFPGKPKLFIHRVGRAARAGRIGTAYSLVSPEEMAHMVDLHLFLGKKLSNTNSHNAFGKIPQAILDHQADQIAHILSTSSDLTQLHRVVKNAYKLYFKTRPVASPESVQRAKEIPDSVPVHPIFGSDMNSADVERFDMVNSLKNFRPQQTIMELQQRNRLVPATVRTNIPGTPLGTGESAVEIMKKKNFIHGGLIEKHREQSEETKKRKAREFKTEEQAMEPKSKKSKANADGSFKDEDFFMEMTKPDMQRERGLSVREDFNRNAAEAMIDLLPDEGDHLHRKQQSMKWDRKKKKMVGPALTASKQFGTISKPTKIRNESGHVILEKDKTKMYKDWQRKSKMTIPKLGEEENPNSGGSLAEMRRRKFRHNKATSAVKDELKNTEQIAKSRKVKENNKRNHQGKRKPGAHPQKTKRLEAKRVKLNARSKILVH